MQGVCIDVGLSNILRKDQTYFLFEHGPRNFYVSKFNNPKSHCGSFQRKYFKLIQEQPKKLKRFVAIVSRRYSWYTIGDEYVITEKDHNGYFHVYNKKKPHRGPIGSYLNSFFDIVAPFAEAQAAILEAEATASVIVPVEPDKPEIQEAGQPGMVITRITIKKAKPKKEKPKKLTRAEQLEENGQMNLFDF